MPRLISCVIGVSIVVRCCTAITIPQPPNPEPIEVVELPLPPAIASTAEGACDRKANSKRTGCISRDLNEFQAGDFTPDGDHVIVNVEFVGAPAAPDPASIYSGEQVILVKANGKTFSNGDAWKCLSCGVPSKNAQSLDDQRDYPHVFRSGDKALWGHNVLDCGGKLLQSEKCTPERTHIYPIHWDTASDGSGFGGHPRELRLHPDDVHLGWSSFTNSGGQFCYFGRLKFNPSPRAGEPLAPRYDLVNVNLLVEPDSKPAIYLDSNEVKINHSAITVGELRGFTGTGSEIMYIGSPVEANNIDIFAVHVKTGKVRRLTSHPEYADPIASSHDDNWLVTMDTRGSDRQMWMSGMRQVPPLLDIVTVTVASSTRNNGPRRFFQPILIDGYGDRGDYFGQQVNAEGDGTNGAANDVNWNGRADPSFSPDGTQITYWQALVVSPSCGGDNPLPCPQSTSQGGRTYRLMLARLTSRHPKSPPPVYRIPDTIPWATPFPPGSTVPTASTLDPGSYKLYGKVSGVADVTLLEGPGGSGIQTVVVSYSEYSDDGDHILNGYENATVIVDANNPWTNTVHWFSELVQTGIVNATKATGQEGFHLEIDAVTNIFNANGTLTTTINGVIYHQPANGT
jgi:hypothetical protein